MNSRFHLIVSTPYSVLVDEPDVKSIRADDDSGGFGIWPGHADLLTVTQDTVVRWRLANGEFRYCAVRSGVLMSLGGAVVRIACREGVCGDDLDLLQQVVKQYRLNKIDLARDANVNQLRLHTQAMRQIMYLLTPQSQSADLPLDLKH